MPFSSEEPSVYPDKAQAERAFETSRERSLVEMSLQELLTAARDEREGLKYQQTIGGHTERIEYGGSSIGNDEEVHTPKESITSVLKGDSSRYREICEVIATKLIHMDEKDENLKNFNKINVGDDTQALVQTKQHVDKILKDKHEKSQNDVNALYQHFLHKGEESQQLVRPLQIVLSGGKISSEETLNQLRNYKNALLDPKEGGSIADKLKDTGDHIAIKVLKGILLTLGTGLIYGIYALTQAVTGEASYKWIDNPGERLAKNAAKILAFEEPPNYQSMGHLATSEKTEKTKEAGKTDELEKQDDKTPSSTPTSQGPG